MPQGPNDDDEALVTPVEGRLARLLAEALDQTAVSVAIARYSGKAQAPGDFRLSAEAFGGAQTVARRLEEHPDIERAVGVPPNVYISLTEEALSTLVADAVLDQGSEYGRNERQAGRHALICYSNPNLNKPLHVGHLRNNVVAMAISNMIEQQGESVFRCEIGSDWGRHICQAIVGWQLTAAPEDDAIKADHRVGMYYARFHEANDQDRAALDARAAALLTAMEAGDATALELNRRITEWAADGMGQTYRRIGSRFDESMRESEHMERSRRLVDEGVASGVFQRKDDDSVVIDLADIGLEEVTLARSDGTLVIYAQTLGVDIARYELTEIDDLLTVNGDQWKDGHIVIDAILDRLGYPWAQRIERIYYGMVHSAGSVMSSRRGQAIGVDSFLDETEASMADRLAAAGAGDAGAMAVGLVKHALLRTPYAKVYRFEPDGLFGEPYAEYLTMLDAIAPGLAPAPPAKPGKVTAARARASARLALLDLAAFPSIVDRAATDRDPSRLSRFMRALASELVIAESMNDERVARAIAIVMRRGMSILNIDVPDAFV